MKKRTLLTFILLLSSCAPLVTPSPIKSATSTEVEPTKISTLSVMPSAVPTLLLIDPFQVPTPINTPHPIPAITQVQTPQGWNDERVKGFENTLQFDVRVIEVGFEPQGKDLYIVVAEGALTNISNQSIVVRKTLSTGPSYDVDVIWKFFYNNEELLFKFVHVDLSQSLTADDFVVLRPNDFQRYALVFWLPLKPINKEKDFTLSGKKITLLGSYDNHRVEYFSSNHKYIDVNAWVGTIQSNSVEYVFP